MLRADGEIRNGSAGTAQPFNALLASPFASG